MCLLCSITPASFLVFVSIFSLFSWFFFCSFFFFREGVYPAKTSLFGIPTEKEKEKKDCFPTEKLFLTKKEYVHIQYLLLCI